MKKLALLFIATGLFSSSTFAQRVSVVEDASGENCGPCAYYIAATEALVNNNGAILIAYMVDIPSGGTLYNTTKSLIDPRKSYYGFTSAPNARLNGRIFNPSSNYKGHPAELTKAMIDADNAATPPVDVTVQHDWVKGTDSIKVTVVLTATNADYTPKLGTKLQIVLTEDLHFATPPGSTSQKDFNDVARQTFPGNTWTGTTLTSTIAKGQSVTYTYTEAKQSYIDGSNNIRVVAMVQEADKTIINANRSYNQWPTNISTINSNDNSFTIYPNPSNNKSYLSINFKTKTTGQITVRDLLGRVVYNSGTLEFAVGTNNYNIPVSDLANGNYLVNVDTDGKSITERLTVSH